MAIWGISAAYGAAVSGTLAEFFGLLTGAIVSSDITLIRMIAIPDVNPRILYNRIRQFLGYCSYVEENQNSFV